MSPELVNALTALVNALEQLARTMGTGWFAATLLGLTALGVGVPWLREWRRDQRVDIVIQHKEKEIERLAEDNRRYRETYLGNIGVPDDVLRRDHEDSALAKGSKTRDGEKGKRA